MQNCHIGTYSQLRLVMPGRGKALIKALLNEKFDEFSNKLVSVEEKFDTTATRKIHIIKVEQIEKKAEDRRRS